MPRNDDLSTPRGLRAPARSTTRMPSGASRRPSRASWAPGATWPARRIMVIIWIGFNVAAVHYRFDPYPFILLNLAFSTQAAYAAPLILLAQNRQADRDRLEMEREREASGARTRRHGVPGAGDRGASVSPCRARSTATTWPR